MRPRCSGRKHQLVQDLVVDNPRQLVVEVRSDGILGCTPGRSDPSAGAPKNPRPEMTTRCRRFLVFDMQIRDYGIFLSDRQTSGMCISKRSQNENGYPRNSVGRDRVFVPRERTRRGAGNGGCDPARQSQLRVHHRLCVPRTGQGLRMLSTWTIHQGAVRLRGLGTSARGHGALLGHRARTDVFDERASSDLVSRARPGRTRCVAFPVRARTPAKISPVVSSQI